MAKTANLYARIEPDVKEQAESILAALGIPASNAITMFYKQIILQKGIPFDVKIPVATQVDASVLSDDELNVELEKGYSDSSSAPIQASPALPSSRIYSYSKMDAPA